MLENKKLELLKRIYEIYDAFSETLDIACRKYCSLCCTQNVCITTLEGRFLNNHIKIDCKSDFLKNLVICADKNRFSPKLTTNRLAELCLKGEEIPEEVMEPDVLTCPLLKENACSIYPARPFGCRCLVSKTDCNNTGSAEIDPFILTVNELSLQFIEHIDERGRTGNLIDVILFINEKEISDLESLAELASNRHMPAIMTPPIHRERIEPILNALLSEFRNFS